MHDQYAMTMTYSEGWWRVYVWDVLRQGTSTRRRIRTVLYVPQERATSPAALLRCLSLQLEQPLLERPQPPA